MVKIESCFTIVSRKIEIRDKFYTCLNQTAYNFSTTHNLQQLFNIPQLTTTFPEATAQPNTPYELTWLDILIYFLGNGVEYI